MNHIASKYRIQHSGKEKKERKKRKKKGRRFRKNISKKQSQLNWDNFFIVCFFHFIYFMPFYVIFLTLDLSKYARASARAARACSYSHVLPWLGQELVTQIENELYILSLS